MVAHSGTRNPPAWWPQRIVSGGQTGVDRAALDWAISIGIPHGGWCPKGRKAEDGVIPSRYQLAEAESANYRARTRLNVRDSDATLVLSVGPPTGGTLKTFQIALTMEKPHLLLNLGGEQRANAEQLKSWLMEHWIAVLNVAGPREERCPGIGVKALGLLCQFAEL